MWFKNTLSCDCPPTSVGACLKCRCLGSTKGFRSSRSIIGLRSLHFKTNTAGDSGFLLERRSPHGLHTERTHEQWAGTLPRALGPHIFHSLACTDDPSLLSFTCSFPTQKNNSLGTYYVPSTVLDRETIKMKENFPDFKESQNTLSNGKA